MQIALPVIEMFGALELWSCHDAMTSLGQNRPRKISVLASFGSFTSFIWSLDQITNSNINKTLTFAWPGTPAKSSKTMDTS